MKKMISFVVMTIFLLTLFSGCAVGAQSANNSREPAKDLQRYARIEVYSADDQMLICEIEDETVLAEFNQNTVFAEDLLVLDEDEYIFQMENIKKKLEEFEPQYIIVTYKMSSSKNNDDTLNKVSEITIYQNTNMMKEQISSDVIKNGDVISEYMTSYYEVSDNTKDFLISLTKNDL